MSLQAQEASGVKPIPLDPEVRKEGGWERGRAGGRVGRREGGREIKVVRRERKDDYKAKSTRGRRT
jgi:hypothetical protein